MIKIVTDSSALLTKAEAKKYDITIVPLNVNIGDKSLTDMKDIDGQELVHFMTTHKKPFPSTSQPAVGAFVEAYKKLTKNGDEVLAICMTHLLSGTVDAARSAAKMVKGKVTVLDSKYTDQNLRHMAVYAAKMANSGKYNLSQILDKMKELHDKSFLCIGVSSLHNLEAGGRINKATGLLSRLLNLHVVFTLTDKSLKLLMKGRGKKTFMRWFKRYLKKMEGKDLKYIGFSYTGNTDFVDYAAKVMAAKFPHAKIIKRYTSAIVAIHTGDNAFAIMTCEE